MNKEKELLKRKPTRLKNFDYSRRGAYFITICTQNRKNFLSRIFVGEGSPLPIDIPVPKLTCCGKILDKWIQEIPNKYQEISVDCYVIMPNHIHLLLSVSKDDGRGDPSPTISEIIGWLKYQATKEINTFRNTAGEKVFQRTFYDHIIRNFEDYQEIHNYIYENPAKWQYDRLYAEE